MSSSSSNASNDEIRKKFPRLLACRKYTVNDLEKAVEESRFGATVSHLSTKYNIPRKTITSHRDNILKKPRDPKYSASDLDKAAQDYGAGMTVKHVSIKYNIPERTLYRNLKRNNQMPISEDIKAKARESYHDAVLQTWPELAGRRRYLASDLDKAVEFCRAGSSYKEASTKYNIPVSTIYYRIKKLEPNKPKAEAALKTHKSYLTSDLDASTSGSSYKEPALKNRALRFGIYEIESN